MKLISSILAAFLSVGLSSSAISQLRDSELEKYGLVSHWEGSFGGAILNTNSVLIQPHTSKNHEIVRVVAGGRLVGTFHGDQIDQSELESSLVGNGESKKPPRLGMKGAQREAEKLAQKYKVLGRKVDVLSDEPIPLVYLIGVNQSGALTCLDAENGTILWRNQLPDGTLPVFGPGASDDHVVITNGIRMHVYELETGRTVMTKTLEFVPTGIPTIVNGKAIVPSVGGRTVIYDVSDPKARSVTIRIGTENRFGIAKSNDNFLAWPVETRLIIAQMQPEIRLWTSFDTRSTIHAKPVAVENGFVAVSESGNLVRCSTKKNDPLVWQTKLGTPCKQSPAVGKKLVTAVTNNNQLFALHLEDGTEAWRSNGQVIVSIAAVTDSRVYAFDKTGSLVIFNSATGQIEGRLSMGQIVPIPNSVSDRLMFSSANGRIYSIREQSARTPTFSVSLKSGPPKTAAPADAPKEPTSETTPVDPFGNSAELPMTTEPTTDDPFVTGKDPF